MKKLSDFVTDELSMDSFVQRLKVISIESISLPNLIDSFKQMVPQAINAISTLVPGLKSVEDPSGVFFDTKDRKKELDKLFEHADFISYRDTLMMVPEGFKGNLEDYLKAFVQIGQDLPTIGIKALSSYNAILGAFISNRDARVMANDTRDITSAVNTRRKAFEALQKHFFKNGSTSLQPIGSLMNRFGDLPKILELTDQVQSIIRGSSLTSLKGLVDESVERLKIIRNENETEGVTTVSGATAKNIGDGAYDVARFVEFISIYLYIAEGLVVTVNRMTEKMKTQLV